MSALPIFHSRARTFWFARLFLPADARASVGQLYAFARGVDDLVDEPGSLERHQVRSILRAWHAWLDAPTSPDQAPDARLGARLLPLVLEQHVPARYLQLLVDGVSSDLDRCEVASWLELREYCF